MSTLIRVRGKRGNLKRKRLEDDNARDAASQSFGDQIQGRASGLSYLEELPIELLQRIFLESRNPNLPCVSQRLHSQILTASTGLQITISYFDDFGCIITQPDPEESVRAARVLGLRQLLSQPWFNFALFEAARQQSLVDSVLAELQSKHPNGTILDASTRREHKERLLKAYGRCHSFGPDTHSEDFFGGEDCRFECPGPDNLEVSFKNTDRELIGPSERPFCNINAAYLQWNLPHFNTVRFMPTLTGENCVSPSMFRRPFMQAKGDLLEHLLLMCASRTRWISDDLVQAWEDGLAEALEDACLPAITCLLIVHSPLENRLKDLGSWETRRSTPARDSDLWLQSAMNVWQDAKHPYHQMPWTWNRVCPVKRFAGVVPLVTERHVLICIERFERDPMLYLAVLLSMTASNRLKQEGYRLPKLPKEALNDLFLLSEERSKDVTSTELHKVYETFAVAAAARA